MRRCGLQQCDMVHSCPQRIAGESQIRLQVLPRASRTPEWWALSGMTYPNASQGKIPGPCNSELSSSHLPEHTRGLPPSHPHMAANLASQVSDNLLVPNRAPFSTSPAEMTAPNRVYLHPTIFRNCKNHFLCRTKVEEGWREGAIFAMVEHTPCHGKRNGRRKMFECFPKKDQVVPYALRLERRNNQPQDMKLAEKTRTSSSS